MKSIGGLLSLFSCASLSFACGASGSLPGSAYPATSSANALAIEQANAAPPSRAGSSPPPQASAPCPTPSTASAAPASEPAAAGALATESASPSAATAAGSSSVERAPSSARNHRGKVKELFALMDMQRVIDATLEDTIATQIKTNPALAQFKDIMLEFLAKHMSWKSLERGFVEDYVETFSQAEIEDMIAFYKTPTGAKAIAAMPALMKRGSQRGLARVEEHMPELRKTIEERVKSP